LPSITGSVVWAARNASISGCFCSAAETLAMNRPNSEAGRIPVASFSRFATLRVGRMSTRAQLSMLRTYRLLSTKVAGDQTRSSRTGMFAISS
jgi:hypothetical protein